MAAWPQASLVTLGCLDILSMVDFLLENFVALTSALGLDFHPAKPNIILPVGISFYTFQTLSYTLDMYRKTSPPEKSLLDFSLFVTFLPHLVAGPIVRPPQLIPQFKAAACCNQGTNDEGLVFAFPGVVYEKCTSRYVAGVIRGYGFWCTHAFGGSRCMAGSTRFLRPNIF